MKCRSGFIIYLDRRCLFDKVGEIVHLLLNSLTASQKNKFIDFIASAKKVETATNRLEKVIQMLENREKMK